jgi:cytoskeletal protein CcmA (bactofilin family)
MFASRHRGTVIAKGLKIVGSVTAEGLVEVNGHIDGELHCTSLIISRGAQVNGTVAADRIVVGTHSGRRCYSKVASTCRRRHSTPNSDPRARRLF